MRNTFFFLFILSYVFSEAQISQKNLSPLSFHSKNLNMIDEIILPPPAGDLPSKNQIKDEAPIFALPIHVDLSLENSGSWSILPNGNRIWQLQISSKDAKNLNFHFNEFYLPKSTTFFIYNSNKTDIRGAFTSINNREDRKFATYLLKGESVILEYNQPASVSEKPVIKLNNVFYGFKSLAGFGDAGACNIDVNCPLGDEWQDEIKAVGLILAGDTSGITWCSGAMVNNTRQDRTPYFLTANHCLTGSESNWAIVYNYETQSCDTVLDGSYSQSVLGAKIVASDVPSDFALLLLDNAPPPEYGVFYAGWDANDSIKDSVVGIHHPRGDIKKISFDYDSAISSGYFSAGETHWQVIDWDTGTTEPTSSGSPLFDKRHKIIGQLHGGGAACGNDLEDYYGKFSHSWNKGGLPSTRLKDWLAPSDTSILVLNGNYFNSPKDTLDAAGISLKGLLHEYCNDTISDLNFIFSNLGKDTIFNAKIFVFLNDSILIDSIFWEDTLLFAQNTSVEINSFISTLGNNTLKVIISNPNGAILDSNSLNDTIINFFIVDKGNFFEYSVKTDFWANETRIELLNNDLNLVFENTSFSTNSTTKGGGCIEDGCYKFIIYDSESDGINNGGVSLFMGDELFHAINGNNFTDSASFTFCICDGEVFNNQFNVNCDSVPDNATNDLMASDVAIVPNPSDGYFKVTAESKINRMVLFNSIGKEMIVFPSINQKSIHINLKNEESGFYLIQIETEKGVIVKKVIKQ